MPDRWRISVHEAGHAVAARHRLMELEESPPATSEGLIVRVAAAWSEERAEGLRATLARSGPRAS